MKSEIYNALASLNRGFDLALESLTILRAEEVLAADYVEEHSILVEELRANVNHMLHGKLETIEEEDWYKYGKMRITIEEGRRNETTLPPPPEIQGRTPAERMDNALRTVLRVPKDVVLRKEEQEKQKREREQRKRQ